MNNNNNDLFNYAKNPLKYFDCIQALLKNLIYSIETIIIIWYWLLDNFIKKNY